MDKIRASWHVCGRLFCDNSSCFVDRAPLQTAQESLVLVGKKNSTFVLSSKAFNISEKSLA